MTEDSYVDTRVQEFADYIQCDPELAQELYFEHKVSEALDNEQKASVDRELSTLRIVSNNLDRAAKACKTLSIYNTVHPQDHGPGPPVPGPRVSDHGPLVLAL